MWCRGESVFVCEWERERGKQPQNEVKCYRNGNTVDMEFNGFDLSAF